MERKIEIKKLNHETVFEIISKDDTGKILSEITIEGLIQEKNCETCGQPIIHADQYDAEFCPVCNEWLSPPCSPDCQCCGNRPERPLDKWPKGY